MRTVVLVSGGLDSYIASVLLPEAVFLYIDVNEVYSAKQSVVCNELYGNNLLSFSGLNLSKFIQNDAYLPNRNILFVTLATLYGNRIILSSTEGDVHPDKDHKFAELSSVLFTHTMGNITRVDVPYKKTTKTEMVKLYLQGGHDPENLYKTTSCYTADRECGECRSCLRRYVAFANNGLCLDKLDIKLPLIKQLIDDKTFSGSKKADREALMLLNKHYN